MHEEGRLDRSGAPGEGGSPQISRFKGNMGDVII